MGSSGGSNGGSRGGGGGSSITGTTTRRGGGWRGRNAPSMTAAAAADVQLPGTAFASSAVSSSGRISGAADRTSLSGKPAVTRRWKPKQPTQVPADQIQSTAVGA